METTNLSKIRRNKMLNTINEIKKNITDEETLTNLSMIENELTKKKYGLIWEEHEERVDKELETQIPTFEEVKDKKIASNPKDKFNFLLEGDNLHSLYLLEKTHKSKIDLIIIDPPYNTGSKEFMYNDTYIDSEDGYKHSKWLSFMDKRLRMAKDLLSNRGFIYINIDQNEFAQLKLLCDEIFGEKNYVNEIIWQKLTASKSQSIYFSNLHEKILVYRKSEEAVMKKLYFAVDEKDKNYPYIEENTGRKYGSFDFTQSGQGSAKYFGDKLLEPPKGKHWIWSQQKIDEGLKNGTIIFTSNGLPRVKRYLDNKKGNPIGDIWINNGVTNLSSNDKERVGFDTQKPLSMIQRILDTMPNDILVLDFFAGSGTTGHGVLLQNTFDNGTRHFILCTNNENQICENITYKRIKNVIEGYGKYNPLEANLKYYKCTYIPRINTEDENLHNNLLINIKNLIQLENGIEIDDNKIRVYLDEDELDKFSKNQSELDVCEKVYISSDILLTSMQESIFKNNNIEVYIIPEYYFEDEIMEVM